jgi:predicted outer membrane protein
MDRGLAQTIGLAGLTALLTVFVARVDGAPVVREASGTVAADSVAGRRDSAITVRWLADANVLSLFKTMNERQLAAEDIMLSSWHSDTVRALATSLWQSHTAMRRAVDSLAATLGIVPTPPALTEQISAEFQAQIDSMLQHRGMAFDRAFVQEQIDSHALMADYLAQLSAASQTPEIRAWLDGVNSQVAGQLTQIRTQQRALVVADSIVADSLAKRAAARRSRRPQ